MPLDAASEGKEDRSSTLFTYREREREGGGIRRRKEVSARGDLTFRGTTNMWRQLSARKEDIDLDNMQIQGRKGEGRCPLR